ncbi:hypothetical protein, partial [Thermoflavimicrobium dichotomicum]|uniref:hypothetical protein n=1 Tax=Thermoflavimicrobium dichotomicum TaxID=46223 RepID=UPI0031339776
NHRHLHDLRIPDIQQPSLGLLLMKYIDQILHHNVKALFVRYRLIRLWVVPPFAFSIQRISLNKNLYVQ